MKASDLSYIINQINNACVELKKEQSGFVFGCYMHKTFRDLQDDLSAIGNKIISVVIENGVGGVDFDVANSYNEKEITHTIK